MTQYDECVALITKELEREAPKRALVLGSGLGDVADSIAAEAAFSFVDLPGFPVPSVEGHAGRLIVGDLAGQRVICLQGRAHIYEGHDVGLVRNMIRTLKRLGVEELILTNAAGSLDPEATPGSLMLIEDHINYSGINPLIGPNDDAFGVRFPDMTEAYDPGVRQKLQNAAQAIGVRLHQGVYIMVTGPSFETPAEIKAFATLGATAVGMSTVPECIVADHAGMRVGCISTITNLAAGMSKTPLTHEETMLEGRRGGLDLARLLETYVTANPL
jgi:inosine/guanosine/xanthosine phosphorylase family protein